MTKYDYHIIGAGVFGISTAWHLIRKQPGARIRLFDRQPYPPTQSASSDWNKVIRADYADKVLMLLAREALKMWTCDPMLNDLYHETGLIWISDTPLAEQIAQNHDELKANAGVSIASTADTKKAYGGIFDEADYTGVTKVLTDSACGWVEVNKALQRMTEAVLDAGVEYVVADVDALLLDCLDVCNGLATTLGERYSAKDTILCTGAGTAKLLADSAPEDYFQIGDRLVAAGICAAMTELSEKDHMAFFNSPICYQDVLPGRGGSIVASDTAQMKVWQDIPFRNTVQHRSGKSISVPDYSCQMSQAMRDGLNSVKVGIYGEKAENIQMEHYRICWDSVTPDENFIISPHPACPTLYVATGGSFHAWKFLPILGKYVTKMLDKTLKEELSVKWAWDRSLSQEAAGDMWPRRELKEII